MREKFTWQWYWMPTAVLLIGMFSITMLVWVNHISERQRINTLLVDAIMDVQIKTATAHLWLEEAVSGDDTADEALADMDQAINLVNVVLNGGESEHGLIPELLKDPSLRSHAEELRSMLVNFKMFALERLRNPGKAGIASATEQQFDVAFKEIFRKAGALEDAIDKTMAGDRAKSDRFFLYILVAWTFIIIAASVGLWNREYRRKRAEEGLLKANGQLLSQAEELTEHRERLAELVEIRTAELTTANELLQVENAQRRRMEEEIRKMNEELETKIAERTRQLLDTQEELVHSEKLAMLGQIAGNMGNELRNPLGVMNNAVFYLENVLPDAGETVREYLEIIRSEIDNSQGIISDLFDFCQDKPRQADMISIHELIPECLEGCVLPENIRFQVDLPESLPPVRIDPLQMGQVIRNLVANAVQAMPEGGSLRVAARRVRGTRNEEERQVRGTRFEEERQVRGTRFEERGNQDLNLEPRTSNLDPRFSNLEPRSSFFEPDFSNLEPRSSILEPYADFVEISVADTGEGISEENMRKLFQPLFTTKSRGIGLGLAISRKLIEANGGSIEAESRLGDGATFTVTLPVEGE